MKLTQKDFEWAVSRGLISEEQRKALWDAFTVRTESRSQFNLSNVALFWRVSRNEQYVTGS